MKKPRARKTRKQSKHYKGWYRFLRTLLFPIAKFLFPITAIGLNNIPADDKFILAGNHRSWMDIPVLGFKVSMYMHFVSKEEFLDNKLLNWIFSKIGVFTVNRQNSDLMFMRNVINALGKNEPIAIFPEGTRNRDAQQEMLELKNGTALFAYKTGAAIVPFVIYKKPKFFKRNYIYFAPPITLSAGAQSGMVDRTKLDESAQIIKQQLIDAMETVEDIVHNKKIRTVKKAEKPAVKKLKKERKQLRRMRKAAHKAGNTKQ